MRVVFLGNHTVGVRVLQAMTSHADVTGVVAHPEDPEDGVRYESVFDFANRQGWSAIRGTPKDPGVHAFIEAARPDLLWITDYRYLIPPSLFQVARLGAVNLHPSLLPKYRGRASLNWAILRGETTLGLTAHFVDEGMDTGDIIEQISFELSEDQDVGDCLEILYPLYGQVTRQVLSCFHAGKVPRRPQDHAIATAFPRRRPEDGLIDWGQPARLVCNLVRAVAAPYPGAFTTLAGQKLTIWKARALDTAVSGDGPGVVLEVTPEGTTVQCGAGALLVSRMEGGHVAPGLRFAS